MEQLFKRDGSPAKTQSTDDKGRPVILTLRPCGRCGGAGGSDKWIRTGWTCFDCGGKGNRGHYDRERLYTADQLAKLNATKAKRDATRKAKQEAAAKAEADRIDAERAQVIADHKELLGRMRGWNDPFLGDLVAQIEVRAKPLSEKQLAAVQEKLDRLEAERARLNAAHHVGQEGERLELDLTFVRSIDLPDYGFGPFYLSIFRTDDGSTVTYKGPRWNPFDLPTETRGEGRDRYRVILDGSKVRVRATVKEHRQNRKTGEPETVIARPKTLQIAA